MLQSILLLCVTFNPHGVDDDCKWNRLEECVLEAANVNLCISAFKFGQILLVDWTVGVMTRNISFI